MNLVPKGCVMLDFCNLRIEQETVVYSYMASKFTASM